MIKRRIFLDDAHQAQWDRDNYLVIPFLQPEQVKELQSGCDKIVEPTPQQFDLSVWTKDFNQRKRVNDFIAAVIAPQVSSVLSAYKPLIHSFATKKPGKDSAWHVHQDDTFTDESQFESLSFWIPLMDATSENGTISLVKNSQQLFREPRSSFIEKPFRNLVPLIEKEFLVPIPVKAGEALVFGHKLIHASGPNMSANTRVAAVGVYLPAEAPVLYYYRDPNSPDSLVEELQLPDDYYQYFPLGERPRGENVKHIRNVFPDTHPWTEEEWRTRLAQMEKS